MEKNSNFVSLVSIEVRFKTIFTPPPPLSLKIYCGSWIFSLKKNLKLNCVVSVWFKVTKYVLPINFLWSSPIVVPKLPQNGIFLTKNRPSLANQALAREIYSFECRYHWIWTWWIISNRYQFSDNFSKGIFLC